MARPLQWARTEVRAYVLIAAALWLAHPVAVVAHDPGLSSLDVQVAADRVAVTLTLSAADAKAASGSNGLEEFALSTIEVRIDGGALEHAAAGLEREADAGTIARLSFNRAAGPEQSRRAGSRLAVRSLVPRRLALGHRQLLTIRDVGGRLLAERMLDARADEVAIDLDPGQTAGSRAAQFFALGIRHILAGYDHLLFVAALLLGLRRLGGVAKAVTAFTVAHSITLALAALGLVHAPASIVEPLIAASIVWVGIENLVSDPLASRWKLTFVFGLVHGFGFAGALEELGIGGGGAGVVTPLAGFNAGVEAGQLAIALLLWPLIARVHSSPALRVRLVPACSLFVVAAGAYWFVVRAF